MRLPFAVEGPAIPEGVVLGVRKPRKRAPPPPPSAAVVIPCHNYARYLGECLDSVLAQTLKPSMVLVLDDASDDDPAAVAASRGVECRRVEYRDVHRVRRDGLAAAGLAKYLLLLDADNTIPPDYLADAVAKMEADRSIAFAAPRLHTFGLPARDLEPPETITAAEIVGRNWCDAGVVWRADVLRQSGVMARDVPIQGAADWRMAREVLRAGAGWRGVRIGPPMAYRVHADAMTFTRPREDHYADALLSMESVEIIMLLSGRWGQWDRRRKWIEEQTWPREQVRLTIIDNSHSPRPLSELGIADWPGGVSWQAIKLGRPGMADEPRAHAHALKLDIESVVAGAYNLAIKQAACEYLLFLEDDVHPLQADTIERLLRHFRPDVAAVTGPYPYRGDPSKACAYTGTTEGRRSLLRMDAASCSLGGSGFGCLLARRSVLAGIPLSGDFKSSPHYDMDCARRAIAAGWRWLLAADVPCDHDVPQPPAKPAPAPPRDPALCYHALSGGCVPCGGKAGWTCGKLGGPATPQRCGACQPPMFEPA